MDKPNKVLKIMEKYLHTSMKDGFVYMKPNFKKAETAIRECLAGELEGMIKKHLCEGKAMLAEQRIVGYNQAIEDAQRLIRQSNKKG